jgi:hypothetical protein
MAHPIPEISYKKTALPKGAAEFFATFARFEFALKDANFIAVDNRGAVSAAWDDFADELPADFLVRVTQSAKASTLLNDPPKKQVLVGKALDFKKQPKPATTRDLLIAVRRVRNNLFHGGKSGDPEGDRRNLKLIKESRWVLEQALFAHDGVRCAFQGDY